MRKRKSPQWLENLSQSCKVNVEISHLPQYYETNFRIKFTYPTSIGEDFEAEIEVYSLYAKQYLLEEMQSLIRTIEDSTAYMDAPLDKMQSRLIWVAPFKRMAKKLEKKVAKEERLIFDVETKYKSGKVVEETYGTYATEEEMWEDYDTSHKAKCIEYSVIHDVNLE